MDTLHCLINKYNIDGELAQQLLDTGKVRKIYKGSYLYYQDQRAGYIAIPLSGVFGIFPTNKENNCLFYNLITPGIMLNEVQYFLGGESHTDVKAVTDSVVVILPFHAVSELMEVNTNFSKMLNVALAKKQRFSHTLFHLRGEKDAQYKIEKALLAISEVTDGGMIPINIMALASLLNMSRNTVGKEIKGLIKKGILHKEGIGYRFSQVFWKVA
ncbi:Crp/Fnr family transcriptional regulator [Photobacterium sp. DNB22_13_2]